MFIKVLREVQDKGGPSKETLLNFWLSGTLFRGSLSPRIPRILSPSRDYEGVLGRSCWYAWRTWGFMGIACLRKGFVKA